MAWDDVCLLPFLDLDRLLTAYHQLAPDKAEAEIERLIDTYPSQRDQALRARTRLITRRAATAQDLTRLGSLVAELSRGDKGFLAQTKLVQEAVAGIARLQTRLNTIDRPIFREPTARQLIDEIDRFYGQVSGFREPLASEFRAAALAWKAVTKRQLSQVQTIVEKEPVRQVFRAGDPVNRRQEAFVPRTNVIGKLEQQVMLSTGCPGIILYGRRRRGKSTVLTNLTGSGFLPDSVRSAVVSMQDPNAFTSLASLTGLLVREVPAEIRGDNGPESIETLPDFFDFLRRAHDKLASREERLLLALDEYENIDRKIGEGVFHLDLLHTIRESIQTHRNITWVFAGSHTIEDLPNQRRYWGGNRRPTAQKQRRHQRQHETLHPPCAQRQCAHRRCGADAHVCRIDTHVDAWSAVWRGPPVCSVDLPVDVSRQEYRHGTSGDLLHPGDCVSETVPAGPPRHGSRITVHGSRPALDPIHAATVRPMHSRLQECYRS